MWRKRKARSQPASSLCAVTNNNKPTPPSLQPTGQIHTATSPLTNPAVSQPPSCTTLALSRPGTNSNKPALPTLHSVSQPPASQAQTATSLPHDLVSGSHSQQQFTTSQTHQARLTNPTSESTSLNPAPPPLHSAPLVNPGEASAAPAASAQAASHPQPTVAFPAGHPQV